MVGVVLGRDQDLPQDRVVRRVRERREQVYGRVDHEGDERVEVGEK